MRSLSTVFAMLALATAIAAMPAKAGGPTQPPGGNFVGYSVIYFLGRMYNSGSQETIITCNNVGAVDAQVLYEVWTDPSADPIAADAYSVPKGDVNAWGLAQNPGLAVARLSVSNSRAVMLCTAHFQDATGIRGFVPLFPVGKPPKISIK